MTIVEQFKDESDCHDVATTFGFEILSSDLKVITSDIEIAK
jgi:hypothetical protein